MHAPLARHLARFGDPVVLPHLAPAAAEEPQVTLSVAEFEARLEAAGQRARDEAWIAADQAIAAMRGERDGALAAAARETAAGVAQARSEWVGVQAGQIGAQIDEAFSSLAEQLSDGLVSALRPLVRSALVERTVANFAEALAGVLGDKDHPPIVLRGPADMLAALVGSRGSSQGLDLQESDGGELVVTVGGARLETRLAAALAAFAPEVE